MFRNKFHFAWMLKPKNPKFILIHRTATELFTEKRVAYLFSMFFFSFSYIYRIKCDDGYVTVTYPLYIEDRKKNIELNDLNHILYIDYMASIHTIFILFIYLFFAGPLYVQTIYSFTHFPLVVYCDQYNIKKKLR